MDSPSPEPTEPMGVVPHLNFGDAWHAYPRHRWFVGTAWHYTSVEGCFGIVSNHELWASSASMLNDSAEMTYGLARTQEVSARWSPPDGAFEPAVDLLRDALEGLEAALAASPPFVLSASTTPFLLNQWANYGDSSGCALGLKALELLHGAGHSARPSPADHLPLWLQVIYEPESQEAYISELLNELVDSDSLVARAIDHDYEPSRLLVQNLSMLVATLKHPGFRAENEVRFVVSGPSSTDVQYRPTARGIVPYVKLHATKNDPNDGLQVSLDPEFRLPLPITGVHVGPPQGKSESRRVESMTRFLRSKGYEVPVLGAGIPYLP